MGADELTKRARARSGRWAAIAVSFAALAAVVFVSAIGSDTSTRNHSTARNNTTAAADTDRDTEVRSATETRDRLVVFGDSHAASDDSWIAGVTCMDVLNLSMPSSGLLANGVFGSLHNELPRLLELLKPDDIAVFSMGFNDLDNFTVAELIAEQKDMTKLAKATVATVRWTTIPPYSDQRPMAFFLDRLRSRRVEWNDYIMSTPGAIDLAAPLGEKLDLSEDNGDHVHLSASAKREQQKVAAAVFCDGS